MAYRMKSSRPILFIPLFFLLLLFSLHGASLADETAFPLNDPYEIFHNHYKAIGGLEKLRAVITGYNEGRVRYDGLQGTYKNWDKRPLQYRTEEDFEVITQIEGDSGKIAWFFDTNKQLLLIKDPETVKRRKISVLLDEYDHLNPDSPNFTLSYKGLVDVEGISCYDILMENTINRDVTHFYFDAKTFILHKAVNKQPDTDIITTFDDYRWVEGLYISHHQLTHYTLWDSWEETWIDSQQFNPSIADGFFAPPETAKNYTFPVDKSSVTLSFLLAENQIYLPVTVGGDTRYWILDSGASMSVMDEDYAKSLSLEVEGEVSAFGFGDTFQLSFVHVPHYSLGGMELKEQKMYVKKGLTEGSYEPEIAGIMGYDLLSLFVVEINYARQLVTFHLPEKFTYSGAGRRFDAPLKYRTFALPVTLEGIESRWTLDLGAFQSSINYPFAKKNNFLQRPGTESVSQGLTTVSFEKTAKFSCMSLGDFALDFPIITVPTSEGEGAAGLGESGGNLGNSTLKHFNLFLDYPKQQIILEKGREFNKQAAYDKSGLLIGRSEDDQPMVSYVSADTPGEKAGILAGDIITGLNGQKVTEGSATIPMRQQLRGEENSTVTINVLREGAPLTFSFKLESLLPLPKNDCRKAAQE